MKEIAADATHTEDAHCPCFSEEQEEVRTVTLG